VQQAANGSILRGPYVRQGDAEAGAIADDWVLIQQHLLDQHLGLFTFYWFTLFLSISICTFVGQFMSVAMPNAKVANVAVGALSVVFNLFGGYLMPYPKMSKILYAIHWIFPSGYSLSSLVSSEMGICISGTENGCGTIELVNETTGEKTLTTIQHYISDVYGFHHSDVASNTLVLIGFWIALQLFIYLSLKYISHLKR